MTCLKVNQIQQRGFLQAALTKRLAECQHDCTKPSTQGLPRATSYHVLPLRQLLKAEGFAGNINTKMSIHFFFLELRSVMYQLNCIA